MSKEALAVKYRPRRFSDVTEQDVTKAILTEQLKNKTFRNCLLFCGGAGTGKAQPLYSKVLTPNGFITMGDVKVGTEVITGKGNIAKVSGVYPQGIRPIYRITLQDRTHIDVSDEHLNVVYRYNQHKKEREDFVVTTKELLNLFESSPMKLRIDVPKGLTFNNDKELPIDPYLLGALIGDGSLSSGNFGFTNTEEDVLDKVDSLLGKYGYTLLPQKNSTCDYRISLKNKPVYYKFKYKDIIFDTVGSLSKYLNDEGYPLFDSGTIIRLSENNAKNTLKHYPELFNAIELLEHLDYKENCCNELRKHIKDYNLDCKSIEKHIPKDYLLSSFEDRLQLLMGLFDTDGYIDKDGNTVLATYSPQLSTDIAFLVRSLGCRDTVTCSTSGYKLEDGTYISCHDSYSHNIKVPKHLVICSSEKHLNKYRTRMYEPMRNIVNIEYIGNMECQCIMVDHDDHTYISDGFIPTHNTTSARIFANEINDFKGHVIEIDAASHNGVDDIRNIIEDARTQALDSEYKVFLIDECHMITNAGWNAALKLIEEPPKKSIFIFCTTDPQKIPNTILSRVQRYNFQKISTHGIINRLKYIIEQENKEDESNQITFDDSAIEFVAKQADGGMRDAITLLDKCIGYNSNLSIENVLQALGSVSYETMFELTTALDKMDAKTVITVIEEVHKTGLDLKQFINNYKNFVLDLCKYDLFRDFEYLQIPSIYENNIKAYDDNSFSFFGLLLNDLLKLSEKLKWETSPKPLIESTLFNLCLEDK